jgi:hypothetical protein
MHEALCFLCCTELENAKNYVINDDLPCMAHTYTVINITQNEFHELVSENSSRISEAKERVISKDCSQAHRTGMQDSLMTKTAKTSMTMHNLNPLTDAYVSEDGKE